MSLLEGLPHLATAKRRSRSHDSMMGGKDSFTTLFTDKACWRQQASSTEIKEMQSRDIKITHKVFFAEDPELTSKDVLVIGNDTMFIRSITHPDASAGLDVLWKVFVELE